MKRAVLTGLAFAFGLAVSVGGAVAADKMTDVKDRPAFTLDSGHLDSKSLVGMRVNTPDGKNVGEIDRLIVNPKDGKVTHAVVGLGGIAGVGEKHIAVPWSQVKITGDTSSRKNMAAVVERADLESARRYAGERDRAPSASPSTAPAGDRDRDGTPNKVDRAPNNPNKQ
jgi:sporulation protein YlmC with PRC-barrel domain